MQIKNLNTNKKIKSQQCLNFNNKNFSYSIIAKFKKNIIYI